MCTYRTHLPLTDAALASFDPRGQVDVVGTERADVEVRHRTAGPSPAAMDTPSEAQASTSSAPAKLPVLVKKSARR